MAFRTRSVIDGGRRRWWVIAGVSALVLLDVILVVWLIGRPQASEADARGPAVGPSMVAVESPTPTASPSPDASGDPGAGGEAPTSVAPAATVPATRILTAIDGDRAWRASTGACPDAVAAPEFTTDGGATWTTTDATGPTGVTALQRIIATSTEVSTMIGSAAGSCAPTLIRTYVRGDNYAEYPAEVAAAWHLDPADRARVLAPGGAVAGPCAAGAGAVAVAPTDEASAAVLCADGSIATTTDAGVTWSAPVAVSGAQGLDAVDGGYLVARVGGSACAGVSVVLLTPGSGGAGGAGGAPGSVVESGCVPLAGDLAALAGQVAVSAGEGSWWVWAGETLVRSSDRGASWG